MSVNFHSGHTLLSILRLLHLFTVSYRLVALS